MIQVNNGVTKPVKIKWNNIDLPLKAGTPIDIGGNIANNKNAVGIIMQTIQTKPSSTDSISILVAGDVLLDEVEKDAGIKLTDAALHALDGIRFHLKDGKVYDSSERVLLDDLTSEEIEDIVDDLE